jgi:hypothetical protein
MPEEEVAGDTGLEESGQDIPEDDIAPAVEEPEEEPTDTGEEEDTGTFDDMLEGISPEDVKDGTFDEEAFAEQAASFAEAGDAEEGEEGDEGEPKPEGDTATPTQGKTHTIVYRGEEVQVTDEELVNLAQKGYDYDQKVGPHQRLAGLLEQHPDLSEELNKKLMARLSGEEQAPTEEEQESEDPYFDQQFERKMEESGLKDTVKKDKALSTHQELYASDKENYDMVRQGVEMTANLMEPDQIARLHDPSTGAYARLFTKVRKNMLQQGIIKPNGTAKPKAEKKAVKPGTKKQKAGSFRMPAGGKKEPPQKKGVKSVWDMPQADFDKLVRRTKGLE